MSLAFSGFDILNIRYSVEVHDGIYDKFTLPYLYRFSRACETKKICNLFYVCKLFLCDFQTFFKQTISALAPGL